VDGSIRVWELADRRLDRRLFVSERAQNYAQLVEPAFAHWPGKPQYDQKSESVRSVAFSPDGQTLATGAEVQPGRGEAFLQ
jgi:hypothetical protein